MTTFRRISLFFILATALSITSSLTAGYRKIHVQGKLTDSGGTALSGAQTVTFKLYTTLSGGTTVWNSGALSVTPATGGLFNVALATGTPDLDTITFDRAYYLGIAVGADSEMTPRQELGAASLAHGSPKDFTVNNHLAVLTGNVGIGTGTAQGLLHLHKTDTPDIQLTDLNGATGRLYASSGSVVLNSVSTHPLVLQTNSIERMRLDTSGNLVIGTTTAQAQFHLYKDDTPEMRLTDVGGATGRVFASSITFNVAAESAHPLVFKTNATERVRIDSSGNVGIGVSTPGVKVEVAGASSGDLPGLFIYNSSGTAVTETASLQLGRSASKPTSKILSGNSTAGSLSNGYVAFQTRNTDSLLERMRIDKDGNVGIGTTQPGDRFEVSKNGDSLAIFRNAQHNNADEGDTATVKFWAGQGTNPDTNEVASIQAEVTNESPFKGKFNFRVNIGDDPAQVAQIKSDGKIYATDFVQTSDLRLKTGVTQLSGTLNKLRDIQGVRYEWKPEYRLSASNLGHHIGLLAQQVEIQFPEIVSEFKDESGATYKAVSYSGLVPVLLEAIKDLSTEVNALKERIAELEK